MTGDSINDNAEEGGTPIATKVGVLANDDVVGTHG
jgi:hypothetical protein